MSASTSIYKIVNHPCSGAINHKGGHGHCFHGFPQNPGCKRYTVDYLGHISTEHSMQPPCLNEETPAPEWDLVKRHRERLERGEL